MVTSLTGQLFRSFRCSSSSSQIVRHFSRRTRCASELPSYFWCKPPKRRPVYLTLEENGIDYKHWSIHVEEPRGTRDEIISYYFNIATSVLGSENEAKKAMYSVSTKYYFSIGVALPEDLAYRFIDHPSVLHVMPDAYVDPITKDYGGEPVIDGQVAPYHPKYHDYHEFPGQSYYKTVLNEYKYEKDKKVEDASKLKKPPTAYSLFMKDIRKDNEELNRHYLDALPVGEAGRVIRRSMEYEDRVPYLCVADLMKKDYQKAVEAYEYKEAGWNDENNEDEFDNFPVQGLMIKCLKLSYLHSVAYICVTSASTEFILFVFCMACSRFLSYFMLISFSKHFNNDTL